jgi:hypothetical protein
MPAPLGYPDYPWEQDSTNFAAAIEEWNIIKRNFLSNKI